MIKEYPTLAQQKILFFSSQQPTTNIDETQPSHHTSFGIKKLDKVVTAFIG
jgi:hypothetical protein